MLATDAPLRNADGSLLGADAVLVSLLAETLVRIDGISGYLRDHGLIDPTTGEVRTVVEVEAKLRREAADHAEALGVAASPRQDRHGPDPRRGRRARRRGRPRGA